MRRWIGRQLSRLLHAVFGGGRLGLVGALLAVAVVAALVLLIVLAIRGTRGNPVARDQAVLSGPRRPPAEWLAEAVACERAGDWRGALRCRYRALVAELAQRGLVEEIPGRTTGEYRRAVSASLPRAATDFAGATDLFERAWYGDEPMVADDAVRFRSLADRVHAGAR